MSGGVGLTRLLDGGMDRLVNSLLMNSSLSCWFVSG